MKTRLVALSLVFLLILLPNGVAGAQSSTSSTINWHVFSGGGAPATAGNVSLNGSLGQTAIGLSNSSNLNLSSGYWFDTAVSASPGEDGVSIYLPLLFKNMAPGP